MTTSFVSIYRVVHALAEHIKAAGYIEFGEFATYLEASASTSTATKSSPGKTYASRMSREVLPVFVEF